MGKVWVKSVGTWQKRSMSHPVPVHSLLLSPGRCCPFSPPGVLSSFWTVSLPSSSVSAVVHQHNVFERTAYTHTFLKEQSVQKSLESTESIKSFIAQSKAELLSKYNLYHKSLGNTVNSYKFPKRRVMKLISLTGNKLHRNKSRHFLPSNCICPRLIKPAENHPVVIMTSTSDMTQV